MFDLDTKAQINKLKKTTPVNMLEQFFNTSSIHFLL